MSRIGRLPVAIPAGVTVKVDEKNVVTVKGPKGELTQNIHPDMKITIEGAVLTVTRPSDDKMHRSLHGLSRTLINNMVVGVTTGYQKALDVVGVGYRAQVTGKNLVLTIGYSHPVEMVPAEGITFECPNPNKILVWVSTSRSLVLSQLTYVSSVSLNPTMARASSMRPRSSAARKARPVRSKREVL